MAGPGMELPPPMRVMQMMMGHWVSQVMATIAELGVPDAMAAGHSTPAALATACKVDEEALFRLLRGAAAVGLVTPTGDRSFGLSPLSECLRSDSPFGLRDLIVAELAPGHWLPWGRLTDVVRTGKSQAEAALGTNPWDYYGTHPEEMAWFARGMGNLSKMVAQDVVAAFDFSPFSQIADVGGSQGALIAAILKATPTSRGVLFDRPEVIAEAEAEVQRYGLGDRLKRVGGDFFNHVPAECDAYLVKSILHDWDDARCLQILKTIHDGSSPGAKLLVFEMLLSDSPMSTPVKLMDLNMMVMLNGRERSADDYTALLAKGGFRVEQIVPTLGLFAILVAARV